MRLALLLLVLAGCATSRPAASTPPTLQQLPFIEDDFPRALAEAKSRGLPLFVDAWAPW